MFKKWTDEERIKDSKKWLEQQKKKKEMTIVKLDNKIDKLKRQEIVAKANVKKYKAQEKKYKQKGR